jgi:alkaline phosphatase
MTNKVKTMILLAMLLVFGAVFTVQGGEIPQSIVLIISDGTGIGQHTLSYYENDNYAPARFEHVGLMTTHNAKGKVTESGAAATAMATGTKTSSGAIAVDTDGQELKTALEYAQEKGMATGLVATSTITHATPAAFASHVESRGSQDEIARQMAEARITVLFGGGREYFVSKDAGGVQDTDLLERMSSRGVKIVSTLEEPLEPNSPVVGLFSDEAMEAAHEGRNPTTADMTLRALEILETDTDGFFLMVEESQVDWGGHDNNEEYALAEMASLNAVIDACLDYQEQHLETLVLLVADHETGGMSVRGKIVGAGYKAGWTTESHTGAMVPIFATGPGSEVFDAVVDNTFIGQTLIGYILAR